MAAVSFKHFASGAALQLTVKKSFNEGLCSRHFVLLCIFVN